MRRNYIVGIIICSIIIIIGFLFVSHYSFWGSGRFFGYEGYCKYTELKYAHSITIFEMAGLFIFLGFYTIQELFGFLKNRLEFYFAISCIVILNLGFLTYQIVEYPILLRKYGFLGQTGQGELYNPLIWIAVLYIMLFSWWSFRVSKRLKLKYLKVIYSVLAVFLIIILISTLNVEYKVCRG